jgi:glycosyltransferase involved in cell wall biosynthesis
MSANVKRVGIYNRWLATLGGGEKTSLGIAEYLSRFYPVEVISHQVVSKEFAGERLNLDLSKVEFTTIPDRSVLELPPITRNYDLFIDASHLDYFPSYAPLSALLVFFPARLTLKNDIKRWMKSILRDWLDMPLMLRGVQNYVRDEDNHFRWFTEDHLKMRLAPSKRGYHFSFTLTNLDPMVRHVRMYLDTNILDEATLLESSAPHRVDIVIPPSDSYHIFSYALDRPDGTAEIAQPSAVITDLDLGTPRYQIYRRIFGNRLRGVGNRLNYYTQVYSILGQIDTYQVIWTTSAFAQKWITHYWHRPSEVLYPPMDYQDFRIDAKTPRILNVGRFFAGSHNKKHLVMIRAFREMVDAGLKGWEFHLAGGMAPGKEHERYFKDVCQAAEGYPIHIHKEIPYNELIDLYAKSAIYWHASGYGEDEKREPEKFEHYGITTVEAMASGCVPVVIGKGGQPEIVQHEIDGFLWTRLSELKNYTFQLIQNEGLRNEMSEAAAVSSHKFSRQNFEKQIDLFTRRMIE